MTTSVHARNRFKKRIGRELSEDELAEITSLILDEEHSELVKWRKGNDIAIYKLRWRELEFYAIYNLLSSSIITFKSIDSTIHTHLQEYYDEH